MSITPTNPRTLSTAELAERLKRYDGSHDSIDCLREAARRLTATCATCRHGQPASTDDPRSTGLVCAQHGYGFVGPDEFCNRHQPADRSDDHAE